ncbi:glycosyltransferase family 2 protein [Burkholderia vietnamiensis]|uniref:glycosyltransferase family 2 protein n=1 Tax=Burkholderia vietnamiensis TaxID=60552 RepID=UPI001CC723DE|nr:glycosyltransferase family 2 protein [Burkholderia vietnamiensis]MCA7983612.1 glycosyltransferase family 2 protein [Burkholderia vietnamiensis]MDN8071315.1 glycosyltransferase family 2 protein [Burkholderia vietnamiensis]
MKQTQDDIRPLNAGGEAELSVSIVLYRPDEIRLVATLESLSAAVCGLRERARPIRGHVVLVDNGGSPVLDRMVATLGAQDITCTILSGHGNVGYGRGHNLAIEGVSSSYHLILNPDIDLDPMSLARALDFLDARPDVGLLTPFIADEFGKLQYLCRRPPSIPDLAIRGFLPQSVRGRFDKRLARYEMRDLINDHDVVWDPPIVSGCFMLFRTEVLKELRGFDPRYFLYFEDYDLSLRTHDVARVAYVPSVRVIHHGGGASRKGFGHIRMFTASAFKFYNRFGWRLW